MRGAIVLALLGLGLVACETVSPTISATPMPSPAAEGELCPSIDLKTPTGEPLDLTGRWRVNQDWAELFLYQHGSCLYGMARSVGDHDVPPGSDATGVTFMTISSDFTMAGTVADVPVLPGAAEFWRDDFHAEVGFFEFGGTTWPAIHEFNPRPEGPEFSGYVFVPEDALSDRVTLVGTYGFDAPDCDWLDVDGQRYALDQTAALLDHRPDAVRLAAGRIIGPQGAAAAPGDQLRVDAQIGPSFFRPGCQESVLLVWDMAVEP